ncbi:MAG: phenylalanine--tRNA ligase subunit beta [Chloroflexi bacterium HGW-Chloroflexi-9]|nr:MAG: phenylalanine--tRNA ligase subunit beta [Chloroflexi bacterium HGW-Chloroflexi-9]
MLVSLKWLRDYVDLPRDLDVDDLAHRLTMASAEIEGIHRVGAQWDRSLITVGEALTVEPHPNADRLRLVTVNYGGAEPQRVVCGAPNVAAGQKIAFAREGAKVRDGHTGKEAVLKRAAIRGVESAGMVLSERELGLSEAHEGIVVLPADAPVGTPLADYLGDVILDVHVWPNRADMMSMVGVAREVAAILGVPMHMPDPQVIAGGGPASEAVSVRIDDPDLCWRYVAMVIEGVTVGPSPEWLQDRLRAAGQRPISNVVDVTNYVMLELGQPLHAFDLDTVQGEVGVRLARAGETLRTLDGQDRTLAPDTLLITDASGPIALAGVMGGAATEVREHTTRILLEAARFDPTSIRRTSTRLGLRSEASSRFERGLSPELAMVAARRAAQLFVEVCGGTARQGEVDVYPVAVERTPVAITRQRLDTVIGVHVPTAEVTGILETLGFEVLATDGGRADGTFEVRAPWWRTDIAIADDLAEEVVRLAGYDRLPAAAIAGGIPAWEPSGTRGLRDGLVDALVEAGLQEVITYSLTTDEVLQRVMAREDLETMRPLRLQNTLSSDRQVMRPTLRHSILETVSRGIRAGAPRLAIFEAGRAYIPHREDGRVLPEERETVCGAVTGAELDRWGRATDRRLDFFDAKGILESAFAALRLTPTYVAGEEFGLLRGRTAQLVLDGEPVGVLAEVHPDTLAAFEIDQPVLLFELDVNRLAAHQPERRAAQSVSRFPAVEQDLAVVVDADVTASALQSVLEGSPLVASARVFDVFTGGRLPAGKKSVAFSIRYQVPNRTLTSDDANREQAKLLKRLECDFGAEQRT